MGPLFDSNGTLPPGFSGGDRGKILFLPAVVFSVIVIVIVVVIVVAPGPGPGPGPSGSGGRRRGRGRGNHED